MNCAEIQAAILVLDATIIDDEAAVTNAVATWLDASAAVGTANGKLASDQAERTALQATLTMLQQMQMC